MLIIMLQRKNVNNYVIEWNVNNYVIEKKEC